VAGRAVDAVTLAVARKFQNYAKALRTLTDELLDIVADARDPSEEGVADSVDDRGLAGARRSGDREEFEVREVDLSLLFEGSEALDFELNRTQR
jgi:hypothetical protein